MRYNIVINAILFDIGWFLCLTLDKSLVVLVTAAIVVANVVLLYRYENNIRWSGEFVWLALCTLIGFVVETLLFSTGMLSYENIDSRASISIFLLPPLWIVCMWLLFATLMRIALKVVFKHAWLAISLGLFLAPISYYAGGLINDTVALGEPKLYSLFGISVIWALVMLLLAFIFNRVICFDEQELSRC